MMKKNDFMLDNAYGDDTLQDPSAAVIMIARIQPTDSNADAEPKYDVEAISEFLLKLLIELYGIEAFGVKREDRFSNKTKKQQEDEEKMDDPENDKKQMIEESDRLSSLPDDLIHKILSFNDIKDVIKMSCLSSRWRFIWTTMPCLTFSGKDYTISEHVSPSAAAIRKGRDIREERAVQGGQVEHCRVRLILRGNDDSLVFVKKILDYAFSHNVQQLDITCFYESNNVEFPLSLFSSQSLKHLTLKADCCYQGRYRWQCGHAVRGWDDDMTGFTLTSKWENLTIRDCKMMKSNIDICHPQLSKLNIEYLHVDVEVFNVVAPQLRNLNIKQFSGAILVSAPDLAHLNIECYISLNLSADDFHSLETVDISISHPIEQEPQELFGLLQRLHSVKFLTLNMEILEILSSSVELLSHQHPPFANLKYLKIYPLELTKKANLAIEVINFILDNSPNATFVMISREEILAENNAKKAKWHMADLRVLLEKLEMARINSCWGGLGEQIEQGKKKIDEADIVMSKITDCMKTQFDEYQSRVNTRCPRTCTRTIIVVVFLANNNQKKRTAENAPDKITTHDGHSTYKLSWRRDDLQFQRHFDHPILLNLHLQRAISSVVPQQLEKILENSVEVLKIRESKLESMKILENKLEPLKLQENQPVDGLIR
ncbi:F-box domain containing protein [Tanacetum coccineum]|uniref:F-box domain containing protein n=1 Tax=Tanacetum coccineum TaxID=301880 RepID=A0ABQ5G5S0_9ASTR